ncbi:hypothetical protein GE061_016856, partial [Apolygus lucorum]
GGEPYKLYDLVPGQTYRFRVATRTESGLSDWTQEYSLTTTSSAASTLHSALLIYTVTGIVFHLMRRFH